MKELAEAAAAVIKRWDSPMWKDAPTADYIHRLRAALEAHLAAPQESAHVASIMATATHWAHMAEIDNGDAAIVAKRDLQERVERLVIEMYVAQARLRLAAQPLPAQPPAQPAEYSDEWLLQRAKKAKAMLDGLPAALRALMKIDTAPQAEQPPLAAQPSPEDVQVPNTFKVKGESDDAWIDRITGAQPVGADALPPIESTSAAVHAAWMLSKLANGVESRKAEDGEELMVAYEQLSDKAKELDRGTVRAVYAAIQAAGARGDRT